MWYETAARICYATAPSGFIMESKNLNSISPVKISPNPFRNSVVVYFSDAFSTMVYDISSKPLRTLSGQDRTGWDSKGEYGRKVKKDIYFCLIETEKERVSEKIIVLQ
jgi:hypothetical protein